MLHPPVRLSIHCDQGLAVWWRVHGRTAVNSGPEQCIRRFGARVVNTVGACCLVLTACRWLVVLGCWQQQGTSEGLAALSVFLHIDN